MSLQNVKKTKSIDRDRQKKNKAGRDKQIKIDRQKKNKTDRYKEIKIERDICSQKDGWPELIEGDYGWIRRKINQDSFPLTGAVRVVPVG